jgi:hypothetical protein
MTGQQTFEVPKAKLLEILRVNKEKHQNDYDLAVIGFREEVVEELEEKLAAAKEGKEIKLGSKHAHPTLHVEEYTNVIGLLELTTENTVKISWHDYKQYVKDEWNWKHGWEVSNSLYAAKAMSR